MTTEEELDEGKRSRMLDKIQALLTKASDHGCTEEESQAFYAKAYQLMAAWRIDDVMLRSAGKRNDDKIVKIEVGDMPWNHSARRTQLWSAVGKYNSVIVVADNQRNAQKLMWDNKNNRYSRKTTRNAHITLVGYQSDIDRVCMLATSLDIDMMSRTPRGYYEAQSFYEGFVVTVATRLREVYHKETTATTTAPGFGLAVIERDKEVRQFLRDNVATRPSRAISRSRNFSADSYNRGSEVARSVDIGVTRVGGGSSSSSVGPRSIGAGA